MKIATLVAVVAMAGLATVQLQLEDIRDRSERLRPCFFKPPCTPEDYAVPPPPAAPPHPLPRAEPWYGPPLAPRLEPYRGPIRQQNR